MRTSRPPSMASCSGAQTQIGSRTHRTRQPAKRKRVATSLPHSIGAVAGSSTSADPIQGWRFPRPFARRQDRGWSRLGPVEAHDEIDRVVGCGEPVALLVDTGTVFLDVDRKRAVVVLLHSW